MMLSSQLIGIEMSRQPVNITLTSMGLIEWVKVLRLNQDFTAEPC